MFTVNVSPDMNMYNLLISQGYDPAYALCEFIDNSIHAFQEYSDDLVLEIDIKFYSLDYPDDKLKSSIIIQDGGPGIPKKMLRKALQPAKTPSKVGLSEFGIGMKSAAIWFTNEWALTTWPKGEKNKLQAEFNLDRLLGEGKHNLEVTEEFCSEDQFGTKIELKQLRKRITKDKYLSIQRSIGDIYQRFLGRSEKKVSITMSYDDEKRAISSIYNGFESLVAKKYIKKKNTIYTTGKEKTWTLNVDTEFQGNRVTGFIHLMKNGGYKKNPGLILFRHDRVITGTTDNHYKPTGLYGTSNKAAGMRMQGELNLNSHPVSYTKDSFSFDDEDFGLHLLSDVNGLKEMVKQAEDYRTKDVPAWEESENIDVNVDDSNSQAPESTGNGGGQSSQDNDIDNTPPPSDPNEQESTASTENETNLGESKPDGNIENEDTKSSPGTDEVNNAENSSGTGEDASGEAEPGIPLSPRLDDKNDTRIRSSEKIVTSLNKLKFKKLSKLYYSLCTISLIQHPVLMYVGAWSFFESLSKKSGNTKNDFHSHFSGKAQHWGLSNDEKKSFNIPLRQIAEIGNASKHHGDAMQVSASQLANDFLVLEKLILAALDNSPSE